MILVLHIVFALTSLVLAAIVAARPTMKLVKVVAGFIAATLASGSVLLVQGADVLHLCLMGIVFTVLTVGAEAVAIRRMRTAEEQH